MKKLWLVLIAIASFGWVQIATGDDAFLKALQDELHRRGNPWIAGSTSVSHLCFKEKAKLCGTSLAIQRGIPEEKPSKPLKASFSEWDWRNKDGHNWMSGVRHQGDCGACWAFAWVAAQEARLNIVSDMPETDTDLSEQFVLSCNPYGHNCNGGNPAIGGWVKLYGIPDDECFPYVNKKVSCDNKCSDWQARAEAGKITDWGGVGNLESEIMNGPVTYCAQFPGKGEKGIREDFFYYKGGVYKPVMGKWIKMSHAVCACGWNSQGILIKNSWGKGWGDYGYAYITYPFIGGAYWMDPIPAAPHINFDDYETNEPNDGIWDLDETIDIVVMIRSKVSGFTNVNGVLSTVDSKVIISNDTYNFGSMPKDLGANNSSVPYQAKASSSITDLPRTVPFKLHLTADGGYSEDINFETIIGVKYGEVIECFNVLPHVIFPYGIAFDGTCLWVTDWDLTSIKKFDESFNVVHQIPTPTNDTACTGITWDGSNLWVQSTKTREIYKVDPSDGSVLNSFASPAPQYPVGLAFDGTNLWVTDRDEYKIYEITTSGVKVSEFPVPVLPKVYGGPRGLAFDPSAPDGGNLLLYMTHFHHGATGPALDSCIIWEITRDGSLVPNHTFVAPRGISNGRGIEVNPGKCEYWVTREDLCQICKVRGFYRDTLGVKEPVAYPKISELTVSSNPARFNTSVSFYVSDVAKVSLNIYDIAGKLVCRLIDNKMFQTGNHKIGWNGKDKWGREVPKGIYFYRLESCKSVSVKKIILLK